MSDVVRQLVGNVPAVRFVDRGRCRLKGFPDRWHLWAAEDSVGQQAPMATVGRVAELAVVAELVSSTAAGVGRVLLVEGEAGIGKSHLVGEATARARRAGIGAVEVVADEVVRRPGAVAHGLVDATRPGPAARRRLDELLARAGGSAGGEDLSYAVVEASVDLVEEMARHDPVLVAVEDLHWADDLSLAVLIALVRRAGVSRYSVIGSLRPSPRPTALDRLLEVVRGGAGRHVRLGSLDEVDVNALASALTGAAPGEGLRERLRATAGNPLYVTELLRFLDDDGLLRTEGGIVDVAAGGTPANLHETLVRRLSWLPPETNELLRLASLLGSAFTLHDLAAITGRPVIDVAAWLREASLAGLIVGDGERLAFRHDLIREAIYGHMLPAERRDLHRAAGQALAHIGAPAQQIAEQFARGALPGDLEAVQWLERAADETMLVAPSTAVALLDQAVALAPPGWPGRAALQARMIEPLTLCGRDRRRRGDRQHRPRRLTRRRHRIRRATRDAGRLRGTRRHRRGDRCAAPGGRPPPARPPDEARQLRCLAAVLSILTSPTGVEAARHIRRGDLGAGQGR